MSPRSRLQTWIGEFNRETRPPRLTALELFRYIGPGLLVTVGHMFTFLAFKHAQAQAVAPFYYSFMIWAVALGFVIFGDVPNR